jgi:hypothetical protein
MTELLKELIENEQISEPEVMDVVLGYHKLVKLGVCAINDFNKLLSTLGIDKVDENTFSTNENETYYIK